MSFITDCIEINDKTYPIYIGKDAQSNETIIKMSHPESLWFHLNNISSAHLILESKGDIIPKKYINQVASKLFSYKNNLPNNINVIYTKVKYVKLTQVKGAVIPKNVTIIKF